MGHACSSNGNNDLIMWGINFSHRVTPIPCHVDRDDIVPLTCFHSIHVSKLTYDVYFKVFFPRKRDTFHTHYNFMIHLLKVEIKRFQIAML